MTNQGLTLLHVKRYFGYKHRQLVDHHNGLITVSHVTLNTKSNHWTDPVNDVQGEGVIPFLRHVDRLSY